VRRADRRPRRNSRRRGRRPAPVTCAAHPVDTLVDRWRNRPGPNADAPPQRTRYRPCWTTVADTSGMSCAWCEYATPRSAPSVNSAPQPHRPLGKCSTVSSGA
jgi:hypothetical protein